MKKFLQSRLAQRAAAVGALALPLLARADDTIDTTAAVASITAVKTGTLAIGLAVFGVAVSIKLYKWLRSAL